MNRALKVVELAWIMVAVLSVYKSVGLWGTDDPWRFYFLGFTVLAIFMFYLRRRQRLRYLKSKQSHQEKE